MTLFDPLRNNMCKYASKSVTINTFIKIIRIPDAE